MPSELQKRKWPNLFKVFDANGDGIVERADVEALSRHFAQLRGLEPDSPEQRELHTRFMRFWQGIEDLADTDQDDKITPDEWIVYWTRVTESSDIYQGIIQPISQFIFGLLDLDGDGRIGLDEYRKFYATMGLEARWAGEIFAKLDLDQDGGITIEELLQLTDQFFMGDAPEAPGNEFFGPL